jgi:hypothetical protein
MKPAREVIEVNFEELEKLLERARQGPLGEEDCQKLEAAIHALSQLIELIGEKQTTISGLRALLLKPSTEKTRKVLEQAGLPTPASSSRPPLSTSASDSEKKKPGHGRNGAEAYRGAKQIQIAHASLKPGDGCPECEKGKVYRQKDPALRIRVVGRRRFRPRSTNWSVCVNYSDPGVVHTIPASGLFRAKWEWNEGMRVNQRPRQHPSALSPGIVWRCFTTL